MKRKLFEEDHEMFREMAAEFNTRAVAPHYAQWDEDHMMSRELWTAAGEQGLLGLAVPEEFGGMGMDDYRFRAVLDEEFAKSNHLAVGLAFHLHDDLVLPHLLAYGSDELKSRWLPGMVSGEKVTSIAWTEPGAGSDLRGIRTKAVRDGDDWLISGQKTFIGNGISGDASLVLARTDGRHRPRKPRLLLPVHGQQGRGLQHRQTAGQDGPQGFGHRGTVLRQRPGPARRPRRRGGQGPAVRGRTAPPGPARDRRGQLRRRAAPPTRRPSATRRTATPSASGSSTSRTAASNWPTS